MSQTAITPASKTPWLDPVVTEIRVLLVHDLSHNAEHILQRLTRLQRPACVIKSVTMPAEAATSLENEDYTLILLVAASSLQETFALFDRLADCAPDMPIVVLCESEDEPFADEIIEHGAADCLVMSHVNWKP